VTLLIAVMVVVALLGLTVGLAQMTISAITGSRDLIDNYRRGVADLTGTPVESPYLPIPPTDQLSALFADPATWRDLAWLLVTPVLGVALSLLPLAVGVGAIVVPVLYGVWWALPIGVLVAVGIFAIGPTLLRARGLADRSLLARATTPRVDVHSELVQLDERVRTLTETRAKSVDAQAAELRRIERDLHDGAQARMVAVGLTLRTLDRVLDTDPTRARELVAEARQTCAAALNDLRDLVRGVHPPVLAERGLADAVRALALDTPLPVGVTVDLTGRPAAPIEAAVYFGVAELLANVAKHAGAGRASVTLTHDGHLLSVTVTDDGRGGAVETAGTGLAGVRRRLATFDGTLTVASPAGGPTTAILEVPCALSSQRTCISSVPDSSGC
jgi:signal transduction histidine kinase